LVVSYGKETFIEVCKERDIPVIELQHGIISQYHYGYSFPGFRTKQAFPDHLFTFGEFGHFDAEFPLDDSRLHPIGFPHLEQNYNERSGDLRGDRVLFLSGGSYGKRMSELAVALSEREGCSYNITYKLHPGEYDRWRQEYPWLKAADVEVIGGNGRPLYDLFAESSAQVGVYSTAIYEGLAFGLDTYVLDLAEWPLIPGALEDDRITVVESPDGLASALETEPGYAATVNEFFADDSLRNFQRAIDSITN
jgi:hypothetical protein